MKRTPLEHDPGTNGEPEEAGGGGLRFDLRVSGRVRWSIYTVAATLFTLGVLWRIFELWLSR